MLLLYGRPLDLDFVVLWQLVAGRRQKATSAIGKRLCAWLSPLDLDFMLVLHGRPLDPDFMGFFMAALWIPF
jgi:hypothetical protein